MKKPAEELSEKTIWVDPSTKLSKINRNGSYDKPFKTIQEDLGCRLQIKLCGTACSGIYIDDTLD